MPKLFTMLSTTRCALLAAALLLAPAVMEAQRRPALGQPETVVVTALSVRVRTAPVISSLSIDELREGFVLRLAGDDYQTKDWYAVMLDGRVAYVPRDAVVVGSRAPRVTTRQSSPVMQAGVPASPAPVVTMTEPAYASSSAPASAAPRETSREPAPSRTETADAALPAPSVQPLAQPAPAVQQVASERGMKEPARAAPGSPMPAPEHQSEAPRARSIPGINLRLAVLGTVKPIKSATGLPTTAHISGLGFVGISYHALGLYFAPEMGQGGGYNSQMMGGGASLDLIDLHALRITALGGYTTYSETDTSATPVTAKIQGYSVGGMASIGLFGPVRIGYRGQYIMGKVTGVPFNITRHSFGLMLF